MDIELVNVINYIQSIKQDLYRKYKPELIDVVNERNVLSNHTQSPTENNSQSPAQATAYVRLMRKQRKLVYKNNLEAQENAARRAQELSEQTNKIKITLKDQSNPTIDLHTDLCKPWNKIPNNLKIHAMIKFIDSIVPKLSDEQGNQLRYLLVSSIAQKKLTKQADVDYDTINGRITKIHRLSYENQKFMILDDSITTNPSFPFNLAPQETEKPKKKLLLIKKIN